MEPRQTEQKSRLRIEKPEDRSEEPKKGRFQIDKLEERIAPLGNCHLTPQGQWVGCRHVPIL